jgi:membrane protease YdiL (CAAX protease family)
LNERLETLTGRERWTLAIAAVLAVAGGVFVWLNYGRAFPEAHITFTVNRATSRKVAETFVARHAPRAAAALAGRWHAALFRVDDDAKTYLERELGLVRMGELVASRQVRLWSWSHRYFKPLDKEEVRVDVSPEGEVMGFAHLIPEAAPGAKLDEADARAIAERWLADAFGLDASGLAFIESHREDRPVRRDWTFTFERRGWRAKDATYRIQVEIHGDEASSYREYLKIPDAWTQSYQRLRSGNDTTALVAALGIVLTILVALFVLVREGRRGNVRWRLVLGLTAVAFGLILASSLNDLPIAAYSFDTTGTYGAFVARQVLGGLGSAGGQALLILVLVAAGEPLYRARFPRRLRLSALLERRGWRSKRLAVGLALGYCLAILFIAYQVAFYLIGDRFGAWNPADVPFDNLLNTSFPWLAVLFMGFYPAVSEEFMSRIFSIPLVEKLTRSKAAAVVVPAMIWGFAHANYPAQPFYIRGVEVSLAGLAIGIVLYRFGAIPCLVWHYVVDASYTSILLVRSGNPYFVITAIAGTGALLVPLAATAIGAWRRGGFVADEALTNDGDPAPVEPPPTVESLPAIMAPPVRRVGAIAVAAVAVAVVALSVAPDPLGGVGVRLRPAAVRKVATAFLREHGVDPTRFRLVVGTVGDLGDASVRRYLLEHGGVESVARFVGTIPQWSVRAFRPEDREEWRLQIDDASASVVRFQHVLPEERAGASLSPDAARKLAEAYLRAHGLDPARLEFKDTETEKRPARLDHDFTWKDPARSVAKAEYLVTVTVQGDVVDGETRQLKLPEQWARARARSSAVHYSLIAAKVLLLAGLLVHGLLLLYRAVRNGSLPWKQVLVATGTLTAMSAVAAALSAPLAWANYNSSWPEPAFRVSLVIGLTILVLAEGFGMVLAFALLAACFPDCAAVTCSRVRARVAGPTLAALVAVSAVWLAWPAGLTWIRYLAPTWFSDLPASIPAALATAVPALATLGPEIFTAVAALALLGLVVHVVVGERRWWLRALVVIGLVALVLPSGADRTAAEFATGLGRTVAAIALGWAAVRFVLGRNHVAYLVGAAWLGTLAAASPLLAQPGAFYRANGWILLALAAVVVAIWLLSGARRNEGGDGSLAPGGANRSASLGP